MNIILSLLQRLHFSFSNFFFLSSLSFFSFFLLFLSSLSPPLTHSKINFIYSINNFNSISIPFFLKEIPKETYSFEIEDASLKEKISATKNEEKRFKGINNDELSKCFQEVHEKRQKVEEERNKRKELRKNQIQKEQNTITVQSDATTGATWSSFYPQGIPYMYATASYQQPWYGGLPLPSVAAAQVDEKEWNAFLQRRAQAVKHLL